MSRISWRLWRSGDVNGGTELCSAADRSCFPASLARDFFVPSVNLYPPARVGQKQCPYHDNGGHDVVPEKCRIQQCDLTCVYLQQQQTLYDTHQLLPKQANGLFGPHLSMKFPSPKRAKRHSKFSLCQGARLAKCRRKDATDPGKTKASDGFRTDLRSLGPVITTLHGEGEGRSREKPAGAPDAWDNRTPALHTHMDGLQTARRWGSPRAGPRRRKVCARGSLGQSRGSCGGKGSKAKGKSRKNNMAQSKQQISSDIHAVLFSGAKGEPTSHGTLP